MKKTAVFLAIFLSTLVIYAQNCPIDNWVESNYLFDAKVLSSREIAADSNHTFRDSVVIPKEMTDKYLSIISTAYQYVDQLIRDSIFIMYYIHAKRDVPLDAISLEVDTSYNWVRDYIVDSTVSGNSTFDSIMTMFGFKIYNITYYTQNPHIYLFGDSIINLYALANQLELLDGIIDAEPLNQWVGDANDIEIDSTNSNYKIIFSFGWGDCIAGCAYRHFWEVELDNCNVISTTVYGDLINSNPEVDPSAIEFYPNPVEDKLYINKYNDSKWNIKVYNSQGRLLLNERLINSHINISELLPGVYYIFAETDAEIIKKKIIKL